MGIYEVLFPGDKLKSDAYDLNCKASKKQSEALANVEKTQNLLQQAVIKLRDRKIGILNTSFNDFIVLYGQISKINFTESDGIAELEDFNLPQIADTSGGCVATAPSIPLTNGQEALSFLKGGIVGMVFGGVGGMFFMGMRSMDKAEGQRDVAVARANMKGARAVASECDLEASALNAIINQVNRTATLLTKLNILFRKGISQSGQEISANGFDRKKYSESQKKTLRCTISLAQTIKTILDRPIIDADNKVTEESINAIVSGEEVLVQMQEAFSAV